jgi:predicted double-glycine peptidase
VILEIPDIRQDNDHDCGQAAAIAALRYLGITKRIPSGLCNPVQGMAPDTIEAVFRSFGLAVLSGEMREEDLRHLTHTGRPVLCPITTTAGGHWVVVRGVARGKVLYHCPTHGPSSLPMASWLAGWVDSSRAGHTFTRWGICPGGM